MMGRGLNHGRLWTLVVVLVVLALVQCQGDRVRQCQLLLVSDGASLNRIDNRTTFVREKDELVTKNRIAATQMAIQHLAQRNGSVVSNMTTLSCTVNFTLQLVLAESHIDAVQGIVEWYATQKQKSLSSSLSSSLSCPETLSDEENDAAINIMDKNKDNNDDDCVAIVGPFQRRSIVDTHVVAQSLRIPQVTVGAVNRQAEVFAPTALSHNNLVRSWDMMVATLDYWAIRRQRTYVSIIYDVVGVDTLFGTHAQTFLDQVQVQIFPMPTSLAPSQSREDLLPVITKTLQFVKEMGHHTIIGAFEDLERTLPLVAEVADSLGLVGDDYLWTLLVGLDEEALHLRREVEASLQNMTLLANSSVYRMVRGAALIRPLDPFHYESDPLLDPFYQSWRGQTPQALGLGTEEEARAGVEFDLEWPEDFFQSPKQGPVWPTSFLYDAVISLGFHLCLDANNNNNNNSGDKEEKDGLAPEVPSFDGASGFVQYDADKRYSRAPSSIVLGLHNVQTISEDQGLQLVLVSVREAAGWREYDENVEFVYHDGTTTPPMPLRDEGDGSFIQRGVRASGLFAMALSLTWCVVAALWVWCNRTVPIVKAGQPEFLILLCLGAIIIASSVYPVSLDERAGFDKSQLNAACVSIPWLFVVGSITVDSALFSKLWRINKVFQFKRRSVTVWGVLGPFALLLLSSIVVLTIWTIFHPLYWTREEQTQIPYKTMGFCDGEHLETYATPLLFLTMAPTIMTALMAWKTRDIPSEYSQNHQIFNALLATVQIWIVGLPVYIILATKDPYVYFIGYTVIVLSYAVSVVGLVIGPKMFSVWMESRTVRATSQRVKTSVGSSSGSSGLVGQGGIVVSGLSEKAAEEPQI